MKSQSGHAPRPRVGPSGRTALQLLACCPRIPTDVVAVLLGLRQLDSAAQLLARLRRGGLAQSEIVRPGPLFDSRSVRLWTLTTAGHTILAIRGLAPSLEGRRRLPYGQPERWRDSARQHDVPLLIVAYRLLAEFAVGTGQPMRVAAWEHPWIRSFRDARTGRARHVRLPAAAVLVREDAACKPPLRLLLLPDVGTVPVASHRPVLRGLMEMRRAEDSVEEDGPLLVVAVSDPRGSGARAEAWHSLLGQVARRTGERPLHIRLLTRGGGWTNSQCVDRQLAVQGEQLFALVARHPMLTRQQLATLLNTSAARISHLIEQLLNQGWVRAITPDDVPDGAVGLRLDQLRRLALVEPTLAGRREAARRLLVPAVLAARHHGLGGRAATRRRLLRHLAHTLGANAFFVALACAARHMTLRGGDDALDEWRSAAACARGRFRPDGYGCYRRGPSRFGFFLEYDRGTERPVEYAAKLAAYYRYRNSGDSKREYDGFPTLLFVTTSDAAEASFAHESWLAQQRLGTGPLSMLLTTTGRIQTHADGALGPIWRTPGLWTDPRTRGYWLPRNRHVGSDRV